MNAKTMLALVLGLCAMANNAVAEKVVFHIPVGTDATPAPAPARSRGANLRRPVGAIGVHTPTEKSGRAGHEIVRLSMETNDPSTRRVEVVRHSGTPGRYLQDTSLVRTEADGRQHAVATTRRLIEGGETRLLHTTIHAGPRTAIVNHTTPGRERVAFRQGHGRTHDAAGRPVSPREARRDYGTRR